MHPRIDGVRQSVAYSIPDLKFSCTGDVWEIWFLARETGSNSPTAFPEFQLWINGSIFLKTYQGELKLFLHCWFIISV